MLLVSCIIGVLMQYMSQKVTFSFHIVLHIMSCFITLCAVNRHSNKRQVDVV